MGAVGLCRGGDRRSHRSPVFRRPYGRGKACLGTKDTHTSTARIEKIVLSPYGQRLVANFCGNLTGVLRLEPEVMGGVGAGRGIFPFPTNPVVVGIVA